MLAIKHLLGFLIFVSFSFPLAAIAQPVPDETLGSENSRVRRATVRGREADLIEGGATRGSNLFHSFREFNIRDGDAAYFANPEAIENIFSRVTGNSPSNINGTLGVDGSANLFFMNPNGILFGQNARLDVGGSFVGTTANAIGFGDLGFFSATNPEVPSQLLTVNPSAFLFNQIPIGSIANQSTAPSDITSPAGFSVFGLRVPDGESLLLLGGNIDMDGGRLNAFGGRVELAGLAGVGTVGLIQTDNALSLSFAPSSTLADITLANDARVAVRGSGNGDIVVNADELTAANGGRFVGGVETTGVSGDILVNANRINLYSAGVNGNGAGIYQEILRGASGDTGDIVLNTRSLTASSGGRVGMQIRSGGSGNAGAITINTDSLILMDRAYILSDIGDEAVGSAGNIAVSSRVLQVRDGAGILVGCGSFRVTFCNEVDGLP